MEGPEGRNGGLFTVLFQDTMPFLVSNASDLALAVLLVHSPRQAGLTIG